MRQAQSSNREDLSVPAEVNCAGYVYLEQAFSGPDRVRNDWYLQLIHQGVLIEADGQRLTPGQFILRSPKKPHQYSTDGVQPLGYYWIHFTGNQIRRLVTENRIPVDRICTLQPGYMPALEQIFSQMFREFILRQCGFGDMVASCLTGILVQLGRGIREPAHADTRLHRRMENTVLYIHEHYAEDLRVQTLAAREHLSDSRYRELFRQTFGQSPGEYITRLRIFHACDLLRSTNLPVSRIAESCGYADTLYFSRIFRKKMGISPLGYRKSTEA